MLFFEPFSSGSLIHRGSQPPEVAATYAITAEVRGFGDVDEDLGDLDDLSPYGEPYDDAPYAEAAYAEEPEL